MATASVSFVSTNGSQGNFEVGRNSSGVRRYATYKFTLDAPATSLNVSLWVGVLGASQTYGYSIDTSSANTDSFAQMGTFVGAKGNSGSFLYQTYSFTANSTFAAGTYHLHICCNTNNAGYFHLNSGSVTYTPATYIVSYDANGGTGAPSAQTKTLGVALTLSTTKPTKASTTTAVNEITFNANGGTTIKASEMATDIVEYTFSSWNTAVNGSGTSYASGGSYTADASATLYAQYTSVAVPGVVVLPTAEQCKRAGYTLLGFATSSTATAAAYAPGASYTASGTVTLYAVWESKGLVYIDNGTGFEPYQVWIDNGSSWEQYAPFVDNGTTWEEMS